ALAVGVLDAQDELAAAVTRVQPGEQRRAHPADVQHAGGARSEAGDDWGHRGAQVTGARMVAGGPGFVTERGAQNHRSLTDFPRIASPPPERLRFRPLRLVSQAM